MTTETYAMVRGSAIRITALDSCGAIPDDAIRYAVSKCVARVTISDITEDSSNEVVRDSGDDPALHFVKPAEILGYSADLEFLKVNPAILQLVTGIDPVSDWTDQIIGFDNKMRVKSPAFALEIWSRLTGVPCLPGERKYGYTLFPFLKGGYISGYEISNGLVSFKVVNTQTRWGASWGRGPYDLTPEEYTRLPTPVSGNTAWRNLILNTTVPGDTEGVVVTFDVIDNGTASNPDPLATGTVDGGTASTTSAGLVEGGRAA